MNRALQVVTGISVIISLWCWAFLTIDFSTHGWGFVALLACRFGTACIATGPIYREYLR